MNKLLPKKKLLITLIFLLSFSFVSPLVNQIRAQAADQATIQAILGSDPENNPAQWEKDEEVTFTGKLIIRAEDSLTWLLNNYQWTFSNSAKNPLETTWATTRNIVFGVMLLFVLA